ncbi:hypothetical protein CFC21_053390 [Triticum aestivum]|uniref:Uncharacterized protein n=2 Tax=Triticum aestivum TaxID=4565 RepID=A0A9R1K7V9_WHEAT|nr:hypothetical protein CFC21_053390 [Triticum aestivum]
MATGRSTVGGATMESSAGDAAQVLVKARCSFFLLFLKFKGNQQHTPSSRRMVLLFSDGWMDGWMGWSWRRRTTRRIESRLFSSLHQCRPGTTTQPPLKGRCLCLLVLERELEVVCQLKLGAARHQGEAQGGA